ncbi:TPA: hypothetical protein N0F65_004753 [Lagenidium giganteum]|uniref:Peroxin-7 n=1 Tax=Lagenidium giganteum TaxID=4803 RepID=A0AAV2YX42_9STRA|nr:TPA: hypothetical protein N0F65_004753 [Lagenidium giganteum]
MTMAAALTARDCFTAPTQIDALALRTVTEDPTVLGNGTSDVKDNSGEGMDADDPEGPLLAVAYSALEGNQWHGGVTLLDSSLTERLCELQGNTGIGAIAWCGAERNFLACACDNGEVRLARLTTDVDYVFVPQAIGSETNGPVGHDDVVTGVSAFAFEKSVFATSSWDTSVKLWDVAAMEKPVASFEQHNDLVWCVETNPLVAHSLASGSQDCTVLLWDDRLGEHNAAGGASTLFPVLSMAWHPRRDHVLSVGLEDGSIMTFDARVMATPLEHHQSLHEGPVHVLKYSPFASDLLASGGDDARICLTGDDVHNTLTNSTHSDYVRGLEWLQVRPESKDGTERGAETLLASGSWDKTMRSWLVQPLES